MHANLNLSYTQRRQSGLKSGGSWIWVKKLISLGKFPKNFEFFQTISQKIQFSRQTSEKCRFFQAIAQTIFNFPGKIGHLQLLLGKLFYFSSKVTTFQHTSCT